jgi:diaminopimelate epimerase
MRLSVIYFSKMQGLGNDFVVIDASKKPLHFTTAQIRKMSDRRYGIGFDQLLLVEANKEGSADFNYRIFNSDGSESYQCGNGARCVARFIHARGLSDKKIITLKTEQVSLKLSLMEGGQVQALLDPPTFEPAKIPLKIDQAGPCYTLDYNSNEIRFYVANVGNPHAVIFDGARFDVDEVGQFLGQHTSFPESVNVGFVTIHSPHEIELEVYERGVGRTLACGSGACAAVVAGVKQSLLKGQVRVRQAGGDLLITWPGDPQPIEMIGPAEFVFDGEYSYTYHND